MSWADDPFEPDWALSPGATILDLLRRRRLSPEVLANHLGSTGEELRGLLSGDLPVTRDIAEKLSALFGGSSQFWLNREASYRADLGRLGKR